MIITSRRRRSINPDSHHQRQGHSQYPFLNVRGEGDDLNGPRHYHTGGYAGFPGDGSIRLHTYNVPERRGAAHSAGVGAKAGGGFGAAASTDGGAGGC